MTEHLLDSTTKPLPMVKSVVRVHPDPPLTNTLTEN